MRRAPFIFIVLLLAALLAFGIFRSYKSVEEPDDGNAASQEVARVADEERGFLQERNEEKKREVVQEGAIEFLPPAKEEETLQSEAEQEEARKKVLDGLQWVLDFRKIISGIVLERALANGLPAPPPEEPFDFQNTYKDLHERLEEAELPESRAEALALMQDLDARIGDVIRSFSDPPTVEELNAGYETVITFDEDISLLYKLLHNSGS